jgi:hypothetical protein
VRGYLAPPRQLPPRGVRQFLAPGLGTAAKAGPEIGNMQPQQPLRRARPRDRELTCVERVEQVELGQFT